MRLRPTVGLCAALALLACKAPANAAPRIPAKEITGKAAQLVPYLDWFIEAVRLADEATWSKGETVVRVPQSTRPGEVELSVTFPLPDVETERRGANRVFDKEIPGTEITVKVRSDCLVRVAIDVRELTLRRDADYPDTIRLKLPPLSVTAEFPPDAEATFEVTYGPARSELFDGAGARETRRELYRELKEKARRQFLEESHGPLRAEVCKRLEDELRKKLPKGFRLYVED